MYLTRHIMNPYLKSITALSATMPIIYCQIVKSQKILYKITSYIFGRKKHLPIPEEAFIPYSLKTIRNSCINHYKSETTRQNFYDELLTEWSNNTDEEEDFIYKEEVRAALDKLPEKCRAVFLLKFVSGLKYKEIAEISNISVNTVKYHISEAYRIVKGELSGINIIYLLFFLT